MQVERQNAKTFAKKNHYSPSADRSFFIPCSQ